ncbi:GTP cyclohydrolase [Malaciobacter molluscorum LMG 25693]|uniref:GTP cyclohydrolase n=1 Tax=Malaciobacter molluscorum LMG 25693 TaxID=870501 RepID=A0A2G1DGX3_9BACT|nr:YciI family protein [Malaciobacter molluscorum]AXX92278.1 YciI domain-containing protein [Malaciobacter molluscorum LMG 25693]PHO17737.1 GTP cyclohydrolase [Malaciobacter molluscorum LMG 25693]RXJ93526.1 GTP cyclohydrolase [Malaciobacter molluscorum]
MFIINLTYIEPLDIVDSYLELHVKYLEEQYSKNNFIASGRKVPRNGGVILSLISSRKQLDEIISQDPFFKEKIAKYDIIEFIPSMTSTEFETLKPEISI